MIARLQRSIRKMLVLMLKISRRYEHRQRHLTGEGKSIFQSSLAAPRWLFVLFTFLAVLIIMSSFEIITLRLVSGYIVISLGFNPITT